MQFASLGSGSRGNGTLIREADTIVLVDCGFSAKEAEKRLHQHQLSAAELTAIVVTHEHADHIQGIRVLARKYRLPVYTTAGTAGCLPADLTNFIHEFNCHETFTINDIEVKPFPVPHDAREPAQFVFQNGRSKLGLLTDVGSITPVIEAALDSCDGLLLEANHDVTMLTNGNYPESLKHRVAGRFGHLNNVQSAALLAKIDTSRLQHIIAMHISEKNNSPELVTSLFAEALNCAENWIGIADQDAGFGWRELTNA